MKREYLLFLIGTLAVAFLAVAVIAVVGIATRPPAPDDAPAADLPIGPEDFLFPDPVVTDPEFIYFRPRLEFWPEEMVERWWVDPGAMAEEFLRERADEDLDSILGGPLR